MQRQIEMIKHVENNDPLNQKATRYNRLPQSGSAKGQKKKWKTVFGLNWLQLQREFDNHRQSIG